MMRATILAAALLLAAAWPAAADSGPLRDPTGCATGSAVANCRSLPPLGREPSGSSLRGSDHNKKRNTPHMKTSPLPSEFLPPRSTGLDKGSTGISNQPLLPKSRINH